MFIQALTWACTEYNLLLLNIKIKIKRKLKLLNRTSLNSLVISIRIKKILIYITLRGLSDCSLKQGLSKAGCAWQFGQKIVITNMSEKLYKY